MQVFICYSRADKEFAAQLVEDLSAYDMTVWMDVRSIPSGANWDLEVQKGLDSSDVMLVLLSPSAVSSQNVADEWSYFIEKNEMRSPAGIEHSSKKLIPVIVEACDVPFRLSRRQRVDFTGDYKTAFKQLLNALGSPESVDPESTQRIRPIVPAREKPEKAIPSAVPKPTPSNPVANVPIDLEVGIKTFEVVWSPSYHWFNGLGPDALDGDMMIDKKEIKLIPHAKPILTIPMRSVISASIQRSVDSHLKLTYYGPDGNFRTLYLIGARAAKRKQVSTQILNTLKLLTGRALT